MLGNKKTTDALPIYWKSGVIRKVCLSPKLAETRALMRMVDDGMSMARQVLQLIDVDVKTRIFTDSRPLLELIGVDRRKAIETVSQCFANSLNISSSGFALAFDVSFFTNI